LFTELFLSDSKKLKLYLADQKIAGSAIHKGDRIVQVAITQKKQTSDSPVILVSKDTVIRL
jgi:predicted ribonuclease YlaK